MTVVAPSHETFACGRGSSFDLIRATHVDRPRHKEYLHVPHDLEDTLDRTCNFEATQRIFSSKQCSLATTSYLWAIWMCKRIQHNLNLQCLQHDAVCLFGSAEKCFLYQETIIPPKPRKTHHAMWRFSDNIQPCSRPLHVSLSLEPFVNGSCGRTRSEPHLVHTNPEAVLFGMLALKNSSISTSTNKKSNSGVLLLRSVLNNVWYESIPRILLDQCRNGEGWSSQLSTRGKLREIQSENTKKIF